MKVLGFDVSSVSTGYSVINNGKLLKSSIGLITPSPKKPYGERLQIFESEIKQIIQKHSPDIVVIEDVFRGRNAKTYKVLCMFRGVAIKAVFDIIGKDPISIMASEARSLVGSKIKKEDAFEFITKKFKLDFEFERDNDKADSIVLALAGYTMEKNGVNAKSLHNVRGRKNRKRKRNKKRI